MAGVLTECATGKQELPTLRFRPIYIGASEKLQEILATNGDVAVEHFVFLLLTPKSQEDVDLLELSGYRNGPEKITWLLPATQEKQEEIVRIINACYEAGGLPPVLGEFKRINMRKKWLRCGLWLIIKISWTAAIFLLGMVTQTHLS